MLKEKYIFWDWNGTLLDDTVICLNAMNAMLKRRDMPLLDVEYYRQVFGFPVIDYYKKIGFDLQSESFEELSVEFITRYNKAISTVPLMRDAERVLDYFLGKGKKNIIVSAMQQEILEKTVFENKLEAYFTKILGIDNIYAHSKTALALEYVNRLSIDPVDIIFIGDTLHDYEVAMEIGCRCILIAAGHQAENRLRQTGAGIVATLSDLLLDSSD